MISFFLFVFLGFLRKRDESMGEGMGGGNEKKNGIKNKKKLSYFFSTLIEFFFLSFLFSHL